MAEVETFEENLDQDPTEEIKQSEVEIPQENEKTDNLGEQADNIAEKLAEVQDKYLRLSAEFDNYRKRTLKERYDLIKTAGEDVIKELLPVIDDFDRALGAAETTSEVSVLTEGIRLIHDKMQSILKQKGLTQIETKGLDFDPEVSEAIAKIPAGDENKGKVVDEVQKGYMLNEKIIRYPKVVVGE